MKVGIIAFALFASAVQASSSNSINGQRLASKAEAVIDRYYNSDENWYRGIARRFSECAFIYSKVDAPNKPRKVKASVKSYEDELTLASKLLWGSDKTWQTDVKEKTKSKILNLKRNTRAIAQIIYNCNMYLDEDRIKDAIYETGNPNPYFDQQ